MKTFDAARPPFDRAPVGMVEAGPDGRFLRANAFFCELLGYAPGELVGKTFLDLAHPDDVAQQRVGFEVMLDGELEAPTVFEKHLLRKNGTDVWVQHSASQEREADGTPGPLLCVVVDITERKRTEWALQRSTEQLKVAQRVARIGSWELDITTQRLTWSEEIFRIFEVDPARFDASYEAFLSFVHPEDRALVDRAYRESVERKQPYEISHRLSLPDGRVKYVRELGETTYLPDGTPLRSMGTVQDITSQRTAELSLRASLAEKETLLAEVHHRVKNNLQIISSMLSLQSNDELDPASREALEDARHRIHTMALVHEQLYRSQAFTSVDLSQHLESLATMVASSLAGTRAITVRCELEPVEVPIDQAIPLGLIINELLSNAYKHAFAGRERGTLNLSCRRREQGVEVRVSDDGVGLPDDQRLDASRTLGFRIVRTLVKQLRAELTIERTHGTRVSIRVPEGHQAKSAG